MFFLSGRTTAYSAEWPTLPGDKKRRIGAKSLDGGSCVPPTAVSKTPATSSAVPAKSSGGASSAPSGSTPGKDSSSNTPMKAGGSRKQKGKVCPPKKSATKVKPAPEVARASTTARGIFINKVTDLPNKWKLEKRLYRGGSSKGRLESTWIAPDGKRYRSLASARKAHPGALQNVNNKKNK